MRSIGLLGVKRLLFLICGVVMLACLYWKNKNLMRFIGYHKPNAVHQIAVNGDDKMIKANKRLHRNPWIRPEKYCYKNGNDWSSCAGDHLLYPPSTHDQLLSRPHMCMKEPFCWLQLDWRNTDPPKWSCPVEKNLRFYDMSFHRAVMTSAATLMERGLNEASSTNHTVFLCNCKYYDLNGDNYNYTFKTCPSKKCHRRVIKVNWEKNYPDLVTDADFHDVDALIFGFETTMWESWVFLQKPLVLALWHVANQCKCTKQESQQLFDHLRELAFNSSVAHVIGANTLYHLEYIRHYTGLNPIFLPVTLSSAVGDLSWFQKRNEFLLNSHVAVALPQVKSTKIKLVKLSNWNRNYKLSDLTTYAGVVVVPYSITNGKSVEQYAMNIPMFAPTVEFAKTMINDRTATYPPYCDGMNSSMHPSKHTDSPYEFDPNVRIDTDGQNVEKDVKFWISFAEIYHWPCIRYFISWKDLFDLLETAQTDMK